MSGSRENKFDHMMPLFGFGALFVVSSSAAAYEKKRLQIEANVAPNLETTTTILKWVKHQRSEAKDSAMLETVNHFHNLIEDRCDNNLISNFHKMLPLNAHAMTSNTEFTDFVRGEWLDIRQLCYLEQMKSEHDNCPKARFFETLRFKIEKVYHLQVNSLIPYINEDKEFKTRVVHQTGYLPPLDVMSNLKP